MFQLEQRTQCLHIFLVVGHRVGVGSGRRVSIRRDNDGCWLNSVEVLDVVKPAVDGIRVRRDRIQYPVVKVAERLGYVRRDERIGLPPHRPQQVEVYDEPPCQAFRTKCSRCVKKLELCIIEISSTGNRKSGQGTESKWKCV